MFRKTHSSPDQRSLIEELRKELGPYFEKAEQVISGLLKRYPKQFFIAMIVLIIGSGILSFTVMRHGSKSASTYASGISSNTTSGLATILKTGSALSEVLSLQNQINSILKKDTLSSSDTLSLQNAFKRLEAINHQLNSKK